jgi:hypothetical protein
MRLFDLRMNSSVKVFFLKSQSLPLTDMQVGNCLLSENLSYVACGNYVQLFALVSMKQSDPLVRASQRAGDCKPLRYIQPRLA